MKKILLGIKIILLIIVGAILGAGIFSFVVEKNLYFPNIKEIANDSKNGVELTAYQYSPWFWNKEERTVININDKNNDSNFQTTIEGAVPNIKLIHSGENFALITYSDPNVTYFKRAFIFHRSPKNEDKNIAKVTDTRGYIIAVAPNENGYFSTSGHKIFKRDWQDEIIFETNISSTLNSIIDPEAVFFSNNTKLAFFGTPEFQLETEKLLFIWDLEKNEIDEILLAEKYPCYNSLTVKNNKLYIGKKEPVVISELFITE